MPVKPSITDGFTVALKGHFISNNAKHATVLGALRVGLAPSDLVTVANNVLTALSASSNYFNANTFYDEITCTSVDHANPITYTLAAGVQGTRTGAAMNPAYCKVVMLRTSHFGRTGVGRVYHTGPVIGDLNGLQDSVYLAAFGAAGTLFVTAMTNAINLHGAHSVLSFKDRMAHPVIGNSLPNLKVNFVTARSENY